MSYSVTGADGRRIVRNVSREEAFATAAAVTAETGEETIVSEQAETIVLDAEAEETIAPSAPKRRKKS